jgi:hypothetical protein
MKDASDRVSWELVAYLFPGAWVDALYATRSPRTKLPDGTIVNLNKFAPMGSAVCFPVEALIFWALCVSVVSCTRNVSLVEARKSIYVYGDDIICNSEDQAVIREHLPKFDLMVNEDKCCVHKNFKESCGCDAYKGVDVTPTKIRSTWDHQLSVETYQSWVAYSNAFYNRGYYGTAEFIERRIQSIRKTPYFNRESHDGIGFVRAHVAAVKMNKSLGIPIKVHKGLQVLQVKCHCSKARIEFSPHCDWEELQRVLSYSNGFLDDEIVDAIASENFKSTVPSVVAQHYAVRRRNRLHRRWATLD